MIKLKNIKYLILIVFLFLQSCGAFTKVFKKSNKTKEDIEINVNKEIETKVEDKSKIVIEESADTTVKTKVQEFVADNKVNSLEDIKNLSILTNQFVDIRQNYDSLSKSLKTSVILKPQTVDLKFNKKTTIDKDVKSSSVSKIDSLYKKEIKIKATEKIKEPKNTLWLIVLILSGILIVGYIGYKLINKYRTKFDFLKLK